MMRSERKSIRLSPFWVFAFFLLTSSLQALQIDVSDCPTSNLALTLRAILSAKQSLRMNAYELTSPEIADALIKQIKSGVRTEVLLEGEPCCTKKLSAEGKKIMNRIVSAMENASASATNSFYLMTSEEKARSRRYAFNHAKYIIVDDENLLISSENYTPTGNPVPGGKKGNRGWQTFVHHPSLATSFKRLFNDDSDVSKGDVIQLVEAGKRTALSFNLATLSLDQLVEESPLSASLAAWASNSPITMHAEQVEQLTSPDTSLRGLITFIQGAKKTLDLELMSFNSKWGKATTVSPLADELIAAARRGVKVRLLLNDESVFGKKAPGVKSGNEKTVDYLDKFADKEGLDLETAIADVKAMGVTYIHNKGVLADGHKTLVSSINWNQNSVTRNRETAISITGAEINRHYKDLFEVDWNASRRQAN